MTVSFGSFWKMVFDEDVEMIIMLCNLKENAKAQCDSYWPHKEPGDFHEYPKSSDNKELKIIFVSEKSENELFERTFLIEVGD